MQRNKALILLFILALISAYMLLIPAQAEENTTVPANNTTIPANISQAANQTITVEEAIETVFLIGIILSPVSFIIAVVALWVAMKNRRKVYDIKN